MESVYYFGYKMQEVELMFDSGYPASELIKDIESESNMISTVSHRAYCGWINMCEQPIYSDIICEERVSTADYSSEIPLCELDFDGFYEDMPRASDIYKVFICENGVYTELEKTKPSRILSHLQDSYSYYIEKGIIKIFSGKSNPESVKVIRFARPIPKTVVGEKVIGTIALPIQYLEMLKCRLRGEKYRLIGEDELCAKWISEYNSQIEDFKQYISERKPGI